MFFSFIPNLGINQELATRPMLPSYSVGTPFLRFRVTLLRGRRLFHYIFFHHKCVNFHQHMYTKYHQVEPKPCSSKRLRLQPKRAVPAPQHSTRLHLSLQSKSILELPRHAIFWNPNDAASSAFVALQCAISREKSTHRRAKYFKYIKYRYRYFRKMFTNKE